MVFENEKFWTSKEKFWTKKRYLKNINKVKKMYRIMKKTFMNKKIDFKHSKKSYGIRKLKNFGLIQISNKKNIFEVNRKLRKSWKNTLLKFSSKLKKKYIFRQTIFNFFFVRGWGGEKFCALIPPFFMLQRSQQCGAHHFSCGAIHNPYRRLRLQAADVLRLKLKRFCTRYYWLPGWLPNSGWNWTRIIEKMSKNFFLLRLWRKFHKFIFSWFWTFIFSKLFICSENIFF